MKPPFVWIERSVRRSRSWGGSNFHKNVMKDGREMWTNLEELIVELGRETNWIESVLIKLLEVESQVLS